jgi:hypothetical protein
MDDMDVAALEIKIDELKCNSDYWSIPSKNRLFHLLCAYDCSYVIRLLLKDKVKKVVLMQNNKMYEHGLLHAVGWAWEDGVEHSFLNLSSRYIDISGFFLQFCIEYYSIAIYFQLYWKRIVDFTENNDVVKISYKENGEFLKIFGYLERVLCITNKNSEETQVINVGDVVYVDYVLKNGSIYFNNSKDFIRNDIVMLFGVKSSINEIELDDSVDLVGFSAKQLRVFGGVLKVWCRVALYIYLQLSESGVPQASCLPTQVYEYDIFINKVCAATRLGKKTVKAIVKRLSVNYYEKKDLIMSPFVVSGNLIAWSSLALLESELERNVLKNMCRTAKYKGVADSIIGSKEPLFISEVVDVINSSKNYSEIIVQTKIKKVPLEGEIDILMYNSVYPNEILLIECKTFLSADELLEVESCTTEMQHGQSQLLGVELILLEMNDSEKHGISAVIDWASVQNYYKVVVTPDTHPSRRYDIDNIPYTTLESIKRFYASSDFKSPMSFWEASKSRPWTAGYVVSETAYGEVTLGDCAFLVPRNTVLQDII